MDGLDRKIKIILDQPSGLELDSIIAQPSCLCDQHNQIFLLGGQVRNLDAYPCGSRTSPSGLVYILSLSATLSWNSNSGGFGY